MAGKALFALLLATGAIVLTGAAVNASQKYEPYIRVNSVWYERFGKKTIINPGKVIRNNDGDYYLQTGDCPSRSILLYHKQAGVDYEKDIIQWLQSGLEEFKVGYTSNNPGHLSNQALFAVRFETTYTLMKKIRKSNDKKLLARIEAVHVLATAYFEKYMLHSDEEREKILNQLITYLRD